MVYLMSTNHIVPVTLSHGLNHGALKSYYDIEVVVQVSIFDQGIGSVPTQHHGDFGS